MWFSSSRVYRVLLSGGAAASWLTLPQGAAWLQMTCLSAGSVCHKYTHQRSALWLLLSVINPYECPTPSQSSASDECTTGCVFWSSSAGYVPPGTNPAVVEKKNRLGTWKHLWELRERSSISWQLTHSKCKNRLSRPELVKSIHSTRHYTCMYI